MCWTIAKYIALVWKKKLTLWLLLSSAASIISKTTLNDYLDHTNQILFQQHCQKVIPWDTPGSMPYSWLSEALDLTQMVMDFRKQLKSTYFITPYNFGSNNIAKKSFPGTPQGQCPTPGCPRLWTSPRWSWTFCTCIFRISGPRAFI